MKKVWMCAVLAAAMLLVGCPKEKPAGGGGTAAGTNPGRVEYSKLPVGVQVRAATGAKDKYSVPLAAFHDPAEEKSSTSFMEFGWRDAITDPNTDTFKKYGPMPAGFWVYAAPYWVVWNLKGGKTGP